MAKPRVLNRDEAKFRPDAVFGSPLDIVSEKLLTRGEKLATLERWRHGIMAQLTASGEGMQTRGYSHEHAKVLEQIERAKVQLGAREAA